VKKILVVITCVAFIIFGFLFHLPQNTTYRHLLYLTGDDIVRDIGRDLQFCVEVEEERYINVRRYAEDVKLLGETYIYKNVEDLDALLSSFGVAILRKSYMNGKDIIYGYSSVCAFQSQTDSNVQICVDDNVVTIGFPIIYGEY